MASTSKWDYAYLNPSYLLKQTLTILKGNNNNNNSTEVGSAASTSSQLQSSNSSSSLLSSRDLLLISGAAAVGGAMVAAAVYGTPYLLEAWQLQCPLCKCQCCACILSQQHPLEALKRMGRVISSSLAGVRAAFRQVVVKSETVLEVQQEEASSSENNNGSWTCVQFPGEEGSVVQTSSEADPSLPDPYSSTKRQSYLSWDDYFMSIAFLSAQRSKDPSRQVGACLVGKDDIILGIGYNGFPRGCSDDKLPWAKLSRDGDALKTKFPYVCHAEVNAILNRNHASASEQRLYTTMFPCNECAKLIIQAGISEVVFHTDKKDCSSVQYLASRKLLSMANIKVRQHQPKLRSILLQF